MNIGSVARGWDSINGYGSPSLSCKNVQGLQHPILSLLGTSKVVLIPSFKEVTPKILSFISENTHLIDH